MDTQAKAMATGENHLRTVLSIPSPTEIVVSSEEERRALSFSSAYGCGPAPSNQCTIVLVKVCGAVTKAGTRCLRNPGVYARCAPHGNRTPRSRRPPQPKKRRVNYKKYLGSREWKERRAEWMSRNDCDCYCCGKKWRKGFNLHHRTYERLGKEKDTDMVMVCLPCHDQIHELYRIVKPLDAATDAIRAKNGLPVTQKVVRFRKGVPAKLRK